MTDSPDPPLEILGFRFTRPQATLRRKFGIGDAELNVSFHLYDGYRTPAERAGDENSLELEDLLITVAMNSEIAAVACQKYWAGMQQGEGWHAESRRLLKASSKTRSEVPDDRCE